MDLETHWALKVIAKHEANTKEATRTAGKRSVYEKVLHHGKSKRGVASQPHLRLKASKRVVGDTAALKGSTRSGKKQGGKGKARLDHAQPRRRLNNPLFKGNKLPKAKRTTKR